MGRWAFAEITLFIATATLQNGSSSIPNDQPYLDALTRAVLDTNCMICQYWSTTKRKYPELPSKNLSIIIARYHTKAEEATSFNDPIHQISMLAGKYSEYAADGAK